MEKENFSVFATAVNAIKSAKIENGDLIMRFHANELQTSAVGTVLVLSTILPTMQNIFYSNVRPDLQKFMGEDGSGFAKAETTVGPNGEKVSISRDPQTEETVVKIPTRVPHEHTVKTQFAQTVRGIRTMFLEAFKQPYTKVQHNDPKGKSSANGEYLAFPGKSIPDVVMMGLMASRIAAAHGFMEHVHNFLHPLGKLGLPCNLIREDARDAMVAAERIRDLPGHKN